MRGLIATTIVLLSLNAQAGELPRDPMVQLLIRGESAPVELGSDFLFSLGDALPLALAASSAGATVRSEGKGEYSVACVTSEGRATWLLSDKSDREGEAVVTAILHTPAPTENLRCDAVPELDAEPVDGGQLPGIGAGLADLTTRFGPAEVNEEGLVAFRSHDYAGDGGNRWELIKTVTYHLTDEVVDAMAYELVTVD